MKTPAVLFVRSDSIYKTMECDVWDADRDALKWPGGAPVVAHPPCRKWGGLSALSTAAREEKYLGVWAVVKVRENGGVLEHPAGSKLWDAAGLPEPGAFDSWGGYTLAVSQFWWGHRAEKKTWLYVCGLDRAKLPEIPIKLGYAPCIIGTPGRRVDGSRLKRGDAGWRPECSKKEREATPPAFAAWLLSVASLAAVSSDS